MMRIEGINYPQYTTRLNIPHITHEYIGDYFTLHEYIHDLQSPASSIYQALKPQTEEEAEDFAQWLQENEGVLGELEEHPIFQTRFGAFLKRALLLLKWRQARGTVPEGINAESVEEAIMIIIGEKRRPEPIEPIIIQSLLPQNIEEEKEFLQFLQQEGYTIESITSEIFSYKILLYAIEWREKRGEIPYIKGLEDFLNFLKEDLKELIKGFVSPSFSIQENRPLFINEYV